MTMNPLPPQAYTKDTLLKAYHWLQHQNPSIKEMALTPDILVSLFLKASRDGDHSLERPSVQNFKNELKNLAGMMGELDNSNSTSSTPINQMPLATQAQAPHLGPIGMSSSITLQGLTSNSVQLPSTLPPSSNENTNFKTQATENSKNNGAATTTQQRNKSESFSLNLDPVTAQLLEDIRMDFNLSSQAEALRVAIKLAHVKTQAIFE